MYKPKEPQEQPKAALLEEGVHAVYEQATNPDLNGAFTFRLPSAWEEVAIGSRMLELANGGRANMTIPVEMLPPRAQLFVQAIATLEYVIKSAPKGWYKDAGGRPVLSPGAIADDEQDAVTEVFKAYLEWRFRFRESRKNPPSAETA